MPAAPSRCTQEPRASALVSRRAATGTPLRRPARSHKARSIAERAIAARPPVPYGKAARRQSSHRPTISAGSWPTTRCPRCSLMIVVVAGPPAVMPTPSAPSLDAISTRTGSISPYHSRRRCLKRGKASIGSGAISPAVIAVGISSAIARTDVTVTGVGSAFKKQPAQSPWSHQGCLPGREELSLAARPCSLGPMPDPLSPPKGA